MSRPQVVKPEYFALMEKCWKMSAHARPSCKFIVSTLKKFLYALIDQEKENSVDGFFPPKKVSLTDTIDDVD